MPKRSGAAPKLRWSKLTMAWAMPVTAASRGPACRHAASWSGAKAAWLRAVRLCLSGAPPVSATCDRLMRQFWHQYRIR